MGSNPISSVTNFLLLSLMKPIPFFYYLENLNKDIFFEIDTYWAQNAGYDPAQAIKKV